MFGAVIPVGIAIGIACVIAVNVHRGHEHVQAYKITLVTLHQDGEKIEALCAKYRPTWGETNCIKRVAAENRNLDLNHLTSGTKIFFDKHLGVAGNGKYQNTTLIMGRQFKTIAAACIALRPTWKVKACIEHVKSVNRLTPVGTPARGTQLVMPTSI